MANPPLKQDFVDGSTPTANQLSAAEYNLNAQRTDEAWDYAQSAENNVASLNGFFFDPLAPQFGAVGDGVADDGPAIQAACDAAKAVRGQVVLRKLFKTNQTIVQNDNFGIIGIGNKVGLKAGDGLPADDPILHTVKDGSTTTVLEGHVYGCSVRNLRIDGNARSADCIGWQLDLATNLDVYKVDIHNVKGAGLMLNNSIRETEFFHVHLRACGDITRDMAAVVISQNDVSDAHNNLHFYGLYSNASYGLALDIGATNDTSPVRGIHFYSPMLHGNYGNIGSTWTNDDLTVTHDWTHRATPVVRIRDARTVILHSPRLHFSGHGQPLILVGSNPHTPTTENQVSINDGSYGTSRDISQAFTVNATSDECSSTGILLGDGALMRFTTTGTLPAPLAPGTDYYAIRVDNNTFRVATTRANAEAGTAIDITDTGSGTHTVVAQSTFVLVEAADKTDVVINGGRPTDANPNRPAVINKAGDGAVNVRQFSQPLGATSLTVYEKFSATDYIAPQISAKVVKPSDTSQSNNDVVISDPDLQLNLTPGTWAVRGWMLYEGSTAGDLKIQWWSTPAAWAGQIRFAGQTTAATANAGSQSNQVSTRGQSVGRGAIGAGTSLAFHLDGTVTVDVAGTFEIRWAQAAVDATPTIVKAGSYLIAEQL